MTPGSVAVDRVELARELEAQGVNPDVAMKGRITIHAIVRRACVKCGRPQITTPTAVGCACVGGPFGAVENRGVISDSGPRSFFVRPFWLLTQAIKKRFA